MVQPKILLIFFHASVAFLDSYAVWYDQMFVDLPFPSKEIEAMPLKARHLFLTVWCLVLQALYFTVSLLNDIYGTDSPNPKKPPIIRKIKDVMFSLSFPVAIYVSLIFWGFYCIHKDLIFPAEIERLLPNWMNHVMHTLIIPFISIELFVTKRNYPTRRLGFSVILIFGVTYTLWVNVVYLKTGVWAYPFMDFFNWPMRFVFMGISACIAYALYVFGEVMNNFASRTVNAYANSVNGNTKKVK